MLQTNTVTTNLIKARELIADEKNWWRAGTKSIRNGGLCAMMALQKVVGDSLSYTSPECGLLNEAAHLLFKDSTAIATNDIRGHAAIMKVYDKAVQLSLTKS